MNLALVGVLFLALPARVLHVSPVGPQDGDGSVGKPMRSLEKALAALQPGDHLKLAGGSYPASAGLVLTAPDVVVEGGWSPKFDRRNPARTPSVITAPAGLEKALLEVDRTALHLVLDGVTLDGAGALNFGNSGLLEGSWSHLQALLKLNRTRGVDIRHCTFVNAPGHGLAASVASDIRVRHNIFMGTRASAITLWGVNIQAKATLDSNTILGTWAERPNGTSGHAVDIQEFLDVVVERNLVLGAQGACVRVGRGNGTPVLRKNALGRCQRGALLMSATAAAAQPLQVGELEGAPGLDAQGNVEADKLEGLDPVLRVLALEAGRHVPENVNHMYAPRFPLNAVPPLGVMQGYGASAPVVDEEAAAASVAGDGGVPPAP